MALDKYPFNISLLDPSKKRLAGLLEVKSMDIYDIDGTFHQQGLYSVPIFGPVGDTSRQTRHAYIDMRTEVLHPKVFLELTRLKALYKGILAGKDYAIWDDKLKDFTKNNIIDGYTGYSFFMEHFKDIVFPSNDSHSRELRIKLLNQERTKAMYRYLIVIPAGIRDIEVDDGDRVVEDEINPLYRKVIRASNTISIYMDDINSPSLNTVRWNLQCTFNDIYAYIESILSGKKGFLLSKWAARNIHNGTRNVITAGDAAPRELGSSDAISVSDSVVGLHQYMKATNELSIYNVKTGPLAPIINSIPGNIRAIDVNTLHSVTISPSIQVKDMWGGETGIEDLINSFGKLPARHKPIMIDGYYAALLYRDDKYFKVIYDIDELPKDKDKSKVKPITLAEMFYISVYLQSRKVAGYVTRYPITGTGSIYPSMIYLRTTVKGDNLIRLDDNWSPITDELPAINMPRYGEPFFDSMSVHSSKAIGLGADYDGDF